MSLQERGILPKKKPGPRSTVGNVKSTMEDIYKTGGITSKGARDGILQNWYKSLPYAFVFTPRNGRSNTFYLPISPSNLNITTHWATNIISTMYGTVEEHSEQRYYDIQISGTTGMSPTYYDVVDILETAGTGRAGFAVLSRDAGGFLQRTRDLVESSLNSASDFLGDDKPTSGIDANQTGYAAFHRFYKFLLAYKKDASGESSTSRRSSHPLKFINYKDNNQYDVAITGFQLTKDASNPMLYNYNITMRAYNLETADTTKYSPEISERADNLGLTGIETSIFAKMANKARQAKNVAYAAIAGFKGFGR